MVATFPTVLLLTCGIVFLTVVWVNKPDAGAMCQLSMVVMCLSCSQAAGLLLAGRMMELYICSSLSHGCVGIYVVF